jgi:hypothetical protein
MSDVAADRVAELAAEPAGPAPVVPKLGPDATVTCPIDELEFRPYYTEGACPICGWVPENSTIAEPWTHRADWALVAFIALVVVSIVMLVIVLSVD